jgi:hypothetical protein
VARAPLRVSRVVERQPNSINSLAILSISHFPMWSARSGDQVPAIRLPRLLFRAASSQAVNVRLGSWLSACGRAEAHGSAGRSRRGRRSAFRCPLLARPKTGRPERYDPRFQYFSETKTAQALTFLSETPRRALHVFRDKFPLTHRNVIQKQYV